MNKPEFRLEASFDDRTGRTVAVYLRVRTGKVKETREIKEGIVYADYDAQDALLGVELLGPCEIAVLDGIAVNEPEPVRDFLKTSPPCGMLLAPAGR
jgi:hypothetical protein